MNNTDKTIKITKYIWEHDEYRYALGEYGKNVLIFIGLNPSIGIPEHPDTTYQILDSIAKNHGYDGLMLVNLYPKVLKTDNINDNECEDNINEKNFQIIEAMFKDFDKQKIDYTVLCGWGKDIITKNSRLAVIDKLKLILQDIPTQKIKCLGETESGHPNSPLARIKKDNFKEFDLKHYLIT